MGTLYFMTTGISFGIFVLYSKAYSEYLDRNNYVSTTDSKGGAELGFNLISYILKILAPGYNIYNAVKLLWAGPKQLEENAASDLAANKIRVRTAEEIEARKLEKEKQARLLENYRNNESYGSGFNDVNFGSEDKEYDMDIDSDEDEYDMDVDSEDDQVVGFEPEQHSVNEDELLIKKQQLALMQQQLEYFQKQYAAQVEELENYKQSHEENVQKIKKPVEFIPNKK